jgi:hypothetical protein
VQVGECVREKEADTVKPVYSDHARSWTNLVVMDRWSLYKGVGLTSIYPFPSESPKYMYVLYMYAFTVRDIRLVLLLRSHLLYS